LPRARDCGDLLLLDHVRARLRLGRPQFAGHETIRVEDIVGSSERGADFDGCFRPRTPALARRIRAIDLAHPGGLDEAIEVVRIDRAYFVIDGHKRVSLAKAQGREFIDARVSEIKTEFAMPPNVAEEVIDMTARELAFREHTALLEAVPAARFPVTLVQGYAELQEALESYGYELMQRTGRFIARHQAAAAWYECVFRPTVAAARAARIPSLLPSCTDADIFLAMHHQSRRMWGTECGAAQYEADQLVAKIAAEEAADSSVLRRIAHRARTRRPTPLLEHRVAP
jgi:hypothetical protein